jgi:hypothetical protein
MLLVLRGIGGGQKPPLQSITRFSETLKRNFWLARRIRNRRKEQHMRNQIAPPVCQPPSFATSLPDYITNTAPNPRVNHAPGYNNTALTYAGICLWFVFWQSPTLPRRGFSSSARRRRVSALICGALFIPCRAMLGMKTGLPLYAVVASTFGASGGVPCRQGGLFRLGESGSAIGRGASAGEAISMGARQEAISQRSGVVFFASRAFA